MLISVGTFWTASRPGMSQSLDGPVFCVGNAIRVEDHAARIGSASHGAVMLRLLCGVGEARTSFGINQFGVRRMHCLIGGAMENNGTNAVNGSLAASLL